MYFFETKGKTGTMRPLPVRIGGTGTMTIGRKSDNDLVLKDEWVSRHHAQFHVSAEKLEIEDLDSANGVFVNGERVTGSAAVKVGDMVGIGKTELNLRSDAPTDPFDTSDLSD
jgi:ABC transport system ATP-binding/permease protein